MKAATWERRAPLTGLVFVVLAVTGNALQGSTPTLHGETEAVAQFYTDKGTAIAVGMMLSLVSVFFLAWFLGSLGRHLAASEGPDGWMTSVASGGGVATLSLLAAGFALNSAGALRARETGIAGDVAAVLYDGSLALTGLAASLTAAVLLAATAAIALQFGAPSVVRMDECSSSSAGNRDASVLRAGPAVPDMGRRRGGTAHAISGAYQD